MSCCKRRLQQEAQLHIPGNYHRIERTYGTFVRTFNLPRSVDAGAIKANYVNGVLEIEIPKREEAKPRQIHISVGAKQING